MTGTEARPRVAGPPVALRWFAALALLGLPSTARADLVKLTSGEVLSVTRITYDGDTAVLALSAGGEVRAPRSIIAVVGPDEPPTPPPSVAPPAPPAPAPLANPVERVLAQIDRLAAQFGVPAKLARAVVEIESNYQADAVSPKGAMGLMQLMPEVAREYGVADPFDAEQNLSAGLQHLKGLLNRFSEATALAAYNAGEGAVERYGGIPPYSETRDYVQRVLALAKKP